jgi:hypothetical protein
MRSAQPELIQRVCVLLNGTQLSNRPMNIKPSSALCVCARVCVNHLDPLLPSLIN